MIETGPDYPVPTRTLSSREVEVRMNYLEVLPHHNTVAQLLGFTRRLAAARDEGGVVMVTEEGKREDEWVYTVKVILVFQLE